MHHDTPNGVGVLSQEVTPREKQVLILVGDGKTTKQMAQDLNINLRTVYAHVYSLERKLGIHNRIELARYARSRQ